MIPHSAPTIGPEEIAAATRVLQSGYLAQGREVAAFEEECAAVISRRHAVAISSGTSALHLALEALGVNEESVVALPSYGCVSLITAVHWAKARPLLCDVDGGFNLDAECVPTHVTSVILPHLFGAPAQLPQNAAVVEDIAQSMGGATGRATKVAITSFYATKMLTSGGEGGMLLTDDTGIAGYARDRRDYDNRDEYVHRYNYKMTDLQAAIGRVQLERLPGFVRRRQEIAEMYAQSLCDFPLGLPAAKGHVYFRYVVTTPKRGQLEEFLRENAVEAKRPVYKPIHHYVGGDFPGAERAHAECLSLPIYPTMTDVQVSRVIELVGRFFS